MRRDGVRALRSRSRVVFDAAPDRPHELDVAVAFPERTRWSLSAPDPGEDRRVLRYRHGTRVWAVEAARAASRGLSGDERRAGLVSLELRRALLTGVAGEGWVRGGARAVRDLGEFGRLEATLDDAGRAAVLRALDPDGEPGEELRVLTWRAEAPDVPHTLELWVADARVWSEELLEVRRDGAYLDDFFLPPDRRARRPTRTHGETHRVRRGAGWGRVEDLPEDADWAAARALGLARRAALRAELPGREVHAWLRLDAAGRATALELRVPGDPAPGAGWTTGPACSGAGRPRAAEAVDTPPTDAERLGLGEGDRADRWVLELGEGDDEADPRPDLLLRLDP